MKTIVSIIATCAVLTVGAALSQEVPASCAGPGVAVNPFPLNTADPIFVKSITNAKRFEAGQGNDTFHILHLWGTPYEKGFAQGQIMQAEVATIADQILPYLETVIEGYLPSLPPAIADAIAIYGLMPMLLQTWEWTEPFMRQEYIDEMNGLAAGSGVAIEKLRAYNMFPELTKASCTIVGANGPSTANKLLSQLRGLDIGPDIPIKDNAQVTIYHSDNGTESNTFLTVGWTGMIGALTGFSANGVGIGEKLWINPNAATQESVHGEPWMFVLRNVLEYTSTISGALNSIQDANRTCSIHVGIGSTVDNAFAGLEIAASFFEVFDPSQMVWPGHPYLPGILYWDSHKQPSKNPCLGDLLQQGYGSLTAEMLALRVAPLAQTGDFHCVTFDYDGKYTYIANSRKTFVTEGSDNAFMRQFTRVDMGKLFNEALP